MFEDIQVYYLVDYNAIIIINTVVSTFPLPLNEEKNKR